VQFLHEQIKVRRFDLECQMYFLFEERTEPYLNTMREDSQKKIVYGSTSERLLSHSFFGSTV
jgi:hypothetical protein